MLTARSRLRPITRLVPTGLPIPVVRGPLRGSWWIAGAGAGHGKGLAVILNLAEPHQLRFASKIASGIAFDVGANVGIYSLLFARSCSQVFAFEPSARNAAFLWYTMRINRTSNVSIVPMAVSDKIGLAHLGVSESTACSGLADSGFPVSTVSIDAFVKEYKISPSIVKIDVEGGEVEVLRGMELTIRNSKPAILLSVHNDELRRECLSLLAAFGYRTTPLDNPDPQAAFEYAAHE